jgi:hypothetical protein
VRDSGPLSAQRRLQEDPKPSRALTRALVPVVFFVLAGVAAMTAMAVNNVRHDSLLWRAGGLGLLLLVVVSVGHASWTYIVLRHHYRCPQCGAGTVFVEEAAPAVHQYCAVCNVEWMTGITAGGSD